MLWPAMVLFLPWHDKLELNVLNELLPGIIEEKTCLQDVYGHHLFAYFQNLSKKQSNMHLLRYTLINLPESS